jgi:phage gp37-like protein
MSYARVPAWYWEDVRWAGEHASELHDKYRNRWVAIVNKEVVAASRSLGQATRLAVKKTGRKAEDIFVEFVDSGLSVYGQS